MDRLQEFLFAHEITASPLVSLDGPEAYEISTESVPKPDEIKRELSDISSDHPKTDEIKAATEADMPKGDTVSETSVLITEDTMKLKRSAEQAGLDEESQLLHQQKSLKTG